MFASGQVSRARVGYLMAGRGFGQLATAQWGVRVGDERATANHVQPQLGEQGDVVSQRVERLARDADHHAAAHFIADLTQRPQQGDAITGSTRPGRVDASEQLRVGRFQPQQVAVGAGTSPQGQLVLGPLAQRERDSQLGAFLDAGDEVGDPRAGQRVVLAGLENQRAVAELHRPLGALEDLLNGHSVTGQVGVVGPQAAVRAAAGAMIGDLHQAAQVYRVADVFAAAIVGELTQLGQPGGIALCQPGQDVSTREDRGRPFMGLA